MSSYLNFTRPLGWSGELIDTEICIETWGDVMKNAKIFNSDFLSRIPQQTYILNNWDFRELWQGPFLGVYNRGKRDTSVVTLLNNAVWVPFKSQNGSLTCVVVHLSVTSDVYVCGVEKDGLRKLTPGHHL